MNSEDDGDEDVETGGRGRSDCAMAEWRTAYARLRSERYAGDEDVEGRSSCAFPLRGVNVKTGAVYAAHAEHRDAKGLLALNA